MCNYIIQDTDIYIASEWKSFLLFCIATIMYGNFTGQALRACYAPGEICASVVEQQSSVLKGDIVLAETLLKMFYKLMEEYYG